MRTTCPECGSNDVYYDIGAERVNADYANHILINRGLITRGASLDLYVWGLRLRPIFCFGTGRLRARKENLGEIVRIRPVSYRTKSFYPRIERRSRDDNK